MKPWALLCFCLLALSPRCGAEDDLLQASTILSKYYSNDEIVSVPRLP
jgi:hypothetical protein